MMSDLHNNILVTEAIAPAAATTDNTAFVSAVLDLSLASGAKVEFIGVFGSIADADVTFTFLVEDSADNSSFGTVDPTQLLGTITPGINFASDNKTVKIGYIGIKRYVRVTITPANNSGNIFLAAVWIQAGLRKAPKSTQVN